MTKDLTPGKPEIGAPALSVNPDDPDKNKPQEQPAQSPPPGGPTIPAPPNQKPGVEPETQPAPGPAAG